MHWAAQYIGLPWSRCGRGPTAYDCYGLVSHVQRVHFNRELPSIDVPLTAKHIVELIENQVQTLNWQEVQTPQNGDVVLMGRTRVPIHIGTVVQANSTLGLLHSAQPQGVVFQRLSNLHQYGWNFVSYHRPL